MNINVTKIIIDKINALEAEDTIEKAITDTFEKNAC